MSIETRLEVLTPREKQVCFLIGEGYMNKQIAYELDVTESHIKTLVTKILRKLNLSTRSQVVTVIFKGFVEDVAKGTLKEPKEEAQKLLDYLEEAHV